MNFDSLLIHFGELSTKGENKKLFIRQLYRNIKHALNNKNLSYSQDRDHIMIRLNDESLEPVVARLQDVSGIQKISLVYKGERDIEALKQEALELISNEEGKTFKIETKRGDKRYPLGSYEICCQVADHILDNTSLEVDVHNPDITLRIDIRNDCAYLSARSFPGAGGYPLGMNGKALMLLSGGIDSPVAAYSLLRRGIKIECIHFAAPPYTSARVIDKLTDIIGKLSNYQADFKLLVVPFTKLQEAIYDNVAEPYCITIMRRMMMRIATGVAKKNNCLALATGESIGQVASQTLQSMRVINEVTNYPIIRPLASSDKVEIIKTAERIGTFEISIRPYEDCCTIFKPKAPKTKPSLGECLFYESKWDWQSMVNECIDNCEILLYKNGVEYKQEEERE